MTNCITINEISQKIMFSQIALPASTPARWRASWAVPFWPKTPELELLDKSVISRAHISITIQPGPPQLPLSSEYLSPISQSRRMVMMNQERKSLEKSQTQKNRSNLSLSFISHEVSVSFQSNPIFSSSPLFEKLQSASLSKHYQNFDMAIPQVLRRQVVVRPSLRSLPGTRRTHRGLPRPTLNLPHLTLHHPPGSLRPLTD